MSQVATKVHRDSYKQESLMLSQSLSSNKQTLGKKQVCKWPEFSGNAMLNPLRDSLGQESTPPKTKWWYILPSVSFLSGYYRVKVSRTDQTTCLCFSKFLLKLGKKTKRPPLGKKTKKSTVREQREESIFCSQFWKALCIKKLNSHCHSYSRPNYT